MGPISLGGHHHCSHGQHLSSWGGLWMSGWADGRTGGWTDGQLSVFLVSLLGRTLWWRLWTDYNRNGKSCGDSSGAALYLGAEQVVLQAGTIQEIIGSLTLLLVFLVMHV